MNRLKELRKEKKLSQKAIAEIFEVPTRTWQRWENGESQIKPDKAQALADYFGVSVGYLLGYEVEKREPTDPDSTKFLHYIKDDRLKAKVSVDEIAEFLGVSTEQYLKWENLEEIMSYQYAVKLANFYDEPTTHYVTERVFDEHLDSIKQETEYLVSKIAKRSELLDKIALLDEEDSQLIRNLVDRLLNKH